MTIAMFLAVKDQDVLYCIIKAYVDMHVEQHLKSLKMGGGKAEYLVASLAAMTLVLEDYQRMVDFESLEVLLTGTLLAGSESELLVREALEKLRPSPTQLIIKCGITGAAAAGGGSGKPKEIEEILTILLDRYKTAVSHPGLVSLDFSALYPDEVRRMEQAILELLQYERVLQNEQDPAQRHVLEAMREMFKLIVPRRIGAVDVRTVDAASGGGGGGEPNKQAGEFLESRRKKVLSLEDAEKDLRKLMGGGEKANEMAIPKEAIVLHSLTWVINWVCDWADMACTVRYTMGRPRVLTAHWTVQQTKRAAQVQKIVSFKKDARLWTPAEIVAHGFVENEEPLARHELDVVGAAEVIRAFIYSRLLKVTRKGKAVPEMINTAIDTVSCKRFIRRAIEERLDEEFSTTAKPPPVVETTKAAATATAAAAAVKKKAAAAKKVVTKAAGSKVLWSSLLFTYLLYLLLLSCN
jgi:hypothetical protein